MASSRLLVVAVVKLVSRLWTPLRIVMVVTMVMQGFAPLGTMRMALAQGENPPIATPTDTPTTTLTPEITTTPMPTATLEFTETPLAPTVTSLSVTPTTTVTSTAIAPTEVTPTPFPTPIITDIVTLTPSDTIPQAEPIAAHSGTTATTHATTTVTFYQLAFTLSAAPTGVNAGDKVVFTAVVQNQALNILTGAIFTDDIPNGLVFQPNSNAAMTVDHQNNRLMLALPSLEPSASYTFTYAYRVQGPGQFTETLVVNAASVSTPNGTLGQAAAMLMIGAPGKSGQMMSSQRAFFNPAKQVVQVHTPAPWSANRIMLFEQKNTVAGEGYRASIRTREIVGNYTDANGQPHDAALQLLPVADVFTQAVTLEFNLDGVVNLAQLPPHWEPYVAVYDEASGTWVRQPIVGVDTARNAVYVETTHFSEWAAGAGPNTQHLLFNDPKPNLFTGISRFSYPMWTPKGAGGLQPSLALNYSSGTADSLLQDTQAAWTGFGWSLSSMEIAREINNGACSPCGNGATANPWPADSYGYRNEFVLLFNGTGYPLIQSTTDPKRYYTQDQSFLYIVRHNGPNGNLNGATNTTKEWWEVKTQDGTVYRLGYTTNAEQVVTMYGYGPANPTWQALGYAGEAANVVANRWRVDQALNVLSKTITYTYAETPRSVTVNGQNIIYDQASYLENITYNNEQAQIVFERVTRTGDTSPTTTRDWTQWETDQLRRVVMKVNGNPVKAYELTHQVRLAGSMQTLALTGIAEYGYAAEGSSATLPTVEFFYVDNSAENSGGCVNGAGNCSWPYPRLAQIKNGYGGRVEYDYESDGRAQDKGGLNWRVKTMRVYDGLSSTPRTTTYAYADVKYTGAYNTTYYPYYFAYHYGLAGYTTTPNTDPAVTCWPAVWPESNVCLDRGGQYPYSPNSIEVTNYNTLGYRYYVARSIEEQLAHYEYTTVEDGGGLLGYGTVSENTNGVVVTHKFYTRNPLPNVGNTTSYVFQKPPVVTLAGREYETNVYDANGTLTNKTNTVFVDYTSYPDTSGKVHFVYASTVTNTSFVGGDVAFSQRTEYTYDVNYGNLTTQISYDLYGQPFRKQVTDYAAPNTTQWIISKVGQQALYAWNGTSWDVQTLSRYNYDGNLTYTAMPSVGQLTAERSWTGEYLNGDYRFRDALYTYDANGNVTLAKTFKSFGSSNAYATVDPVAITTTYDISGFYPVAIANPLNQVATMVYDPRLGVALASTDPNGLVTQSEYDKFGRVTKVAKPGATLSQPTAEFEYADAYLANGLSGLRVVSKYHPSASETITDVKFYDGLGHLVQTKNPIDYGASVTTTVGNVIYNALGQVVESYAPLLDSGDLLTFGRPSNLAQQPHSTTQYDSLGQAVRTIGPDNTSSTVINGVFRLPSIITTTTVIANYGNGTSWDVYSDGNGQDDYTDYFVTFGMQDWRIYNALQFKFTSSCGGGCNGNRKVRVFVHDADGTGNNNNNGWNYYGDFTDGTITLDLSQMTNRDQVDNVLFRVYDSYFGGVNVANSYQHTTLYFINALQYPLSLTPLPLATTPVAYQIIEDPAGRLQAAFSNFQGQLIGVAEVAPKWTDNFNDGTVAAGWTTQVGAVSEPGGMLHLVGSGCCNTYVRRPTTAHTDGDWVSVSFKYDAAAPQGVLSLDAGTWNTDSFRRWGLYTNGPNLHLETYNGIQATRVVKFLMPLRQNVWYRALFKLGGTGMFVLRVWERDNPAVVVERQVAFGARWSNQPWYFGAYPMLGNLDLDNYAEYNFDTQTRYGYDALGHLTQVTDTVGTSTVITYNALGQKVAMADPDMGVWRYSYDAAGNLITQTDALYQTLWFNYDALNRLTSKGYTTTAGSGILLVNTYGATAPTIGYPLAMTDTSGSTRWTYDMLGHLQAEAKQIDGAGVYVTQYAYDGLDRPTVITYPTGEAVRQTYNVQGTLKTVSSDLAAYATNRLYNVRGQVTGMTVGNVGLTYTYSDTTGRLTRIQAQTALDMSYEYDVLGNIALWRDQSAGGDNRQEFTYDYLNRLIDAQPGAGTTSGYTATYVYNAIGNLTFKSEGGTSLTYSYNDPAHKHAATTAGMNTYTYDANGNMLTRLEAVSMVSYTTFTQTWDVENRLLTVTARVGQSAATQATRFIYDGTGRRVMTLNADGSRTVYVNALLEVQIDTGYGEPYTPRSSVPASALPPTPTPTPVPTNTPAPTNTPLPGSTATPTYSPPTATPCGSSNNIRYDIPQSGNSPALMQTPIPSTCCPSASGAVRYSDAQNGNLAISTPFKTPDPCDLLVEGSFPTSHSAIKVNARLVPTDDNLFVAIWKSLAYVVDSAFKAIGEFFGLNAVASPAPQQQAQPVTPPTGHTWKSYYYAGAQAVAVRVATSASSTVSYLLSDHLGSTSVVIDANGTVLARQKYYPYGELRSTTGTLPTSKGYTGQVRENVGLGSLMYYSARFYSPVFARFLSADTIAPGAGSQVLNRYQYTSGNPIRLIDPSGHESICDYAYGRDPDCPTPLPSLNSGRNTGNSAQRQYDLTGYLADAMTAHGKDAMVSSVAQKINGTPQMFLAQGDDPRLTSATRQFTTWASGYLEFNELEATNKIWDIKQRIIEELGEGAVLCGEVCDWYDYSTFGNIHFGYVAAKASIDPEIAAIMGGVLEQRDLFLQGEGLHLEYCKNLSCDNPQDQAAVNFGYYLGQKYPNGITEEQLRQELTVSWTDQFQRPVNPNFVPPMPAVHQPNQYEPDHFNVAR